MRFDSLIGLIIEESSLALKHVVAALISLVFNPYSFAVALFPISAWKDGNPYYAFISLASLAIFPFTFHYHGVKSGKTNWNVDERWKRPKYLLLSSTGGFIGSSLLGLMGAKYLSIATAVYATTAFFVAIASYFIKVSVHVSTAVTTAIVLGWALGLWWGVAFGAIALVVAWSRVVLKAHRPVEVAEAYAISSFSSILILSVLRAIPM
ncbi:hypothetical protein EYM_04480 [Ignicoccus islandicus DSM 13165]|uniref:Uncharacterized protein n=1 Tax=Ignicoccus islandicus DSM 13165 TaxID=940295 RepID=A0A0U3EB09_9CREN|nr:hypothetical protein [Ignicoccus islandicus]ALU12494.1 hypothetical protein EYM_04480 [Ignicoccus islandicus DSM 13165]